MILWNKLKIVPEAGLLVLDAYVDTLSYFKDVYIDKIIIDTQDTYVGNGPSDSSVFTYQVMGNKKELQLEVDLNILKLSPVSTMFFVYVLTKGAPSPATPCGMDVTPVLGTVINLVEIYKKTLGYLKQIECGCEIPKDFIDMILKYKALELCIKTGNYPQAVKYWKKFFSNTKFRSLNSNCGCNG